MKKILIIKNLIKKLISRITNLSPKQRKLILILIDLTTISSVFLFSKFLINEFIYLDFKNNLLEIIFFFIIYIPIYIISGKYKGITKFNNSTYYFQYSLRNIIAGAITYLFFDIKLNFLLIYIICLSFFSIIITNFLAFLITKIEKTKSKKVIIYGAGLAGAQLARALSLDKIYEVTCFIDDNSELWERSIYGKKIKNFQYLKIIENQIDIVCLCIPSLKNKERKILLSKLENYQFKILTVPTLDDLNNGNAKITSIKPIKLEELVFRDIARSNINTIKNVFENKNILITGAGGSIGNEISKHLLDTNPSNMIFLDFSEFNLYSLKNLLKIKPNDKCKSTFILGDCCDVKLIDSIFSTYNIDIYIHCAAYKHVPMVELNPITGMANNIISTKTILDAGIKYNVERAVLISTDKAVRPTNIMGASKRVAELMFLNAQKIISKRNLSSKYSIVRFGNVLGSSGSVIPLFREQLKNGGPITVTHPDVTRYFMTIEEASILVLEAAVLSKGGELFLLDMGEPIKILDLAKKIIKLSGYQIKNSDNPDGDIEIKFTGLREGEKLFEELLIDGKVIKTQNNYIYQAIEPELFLNERKVSQIEDLIQNLKSGNSKNSLNLLKDLIPEWKNH